MKLNRGAKFASRLAVLSMTAVTITATQAAPAHALVTPCTTVPCLKTLLVDVLNTPKPDPCEAVGDCLNVAQVVSNTIDTVETLIQQPAPDPNDLCSANCGRLIQTAQDDVALVSGALRELLTQPNPCQSDIDCAALVADTQARVVQFVADANALVADVVPMVQDLKAEAVAAVNGAPATAQEKLAAAQALAGPVVTLAGAVLASVQQIGKPDSVFQAAADAAYAQSASGNSDIASLSTGFVIPIEYIDVDAFGVKTPKKCTTTVYPDAAYNKRKYSEDIGEDGSVRTTTDCPAGVIASTTVELMIQDFGVPNFSTRHQVDAYGSSTDTAAAYAHTWQDVALYTWPSDYHGYGSHITWSYHAHQEFTKKSVIPTLDSCFRYDADYGGDIEGAQASC